MKVLLEEYSNYRFRLSKIVRRIRNKLKEEGLEEKGLLRFDKKKKKFYANLRSMDKYLCELYEEVG